MTGESDLSVLLQSMQPILREGEYVFCSCDRQNVNYTQLNPIGLFYKDEGLTLILRRESADTQTIAYTSVFRMITLSIHSSLEAVGFLAAITGKLAKHGISVNPVSADYHDRLFVPTSRANEAMNLLQQFSKR